jgi:hypothetical protein
MTSKFLSLLLIRFFKFKLIVLNDYFHKVKSVSCDLVEVVQQIENILNEFIYLQENIY